MDGMIRLGRKSLDDFVASTDALLYDRRAHAT